MKIKLKELLVPQPKSKIKAGDGLDCGTYKFFTSSPVQSKFYNSALYDNPALIFGTGGNASVHYCSEKFSTSTDCLVMYGVEDSNIELIYQYLCSNIHILQSGFKGAGLQHISKDYILNIEIDFPTKENQFKIVSQMRLLDDIIENRKAQINTFDELIKARFVEMFGDPIYNEMNWNIKPLEEVCNAIVDCPHSTPSYTSEDTGFMCIRTSIVKKNHILWDDIEFIPEEEYNQRIQRKRPEVGDIVYTREGAILGIAAIVDRECNVALGQRSMLLSPNKERCLSDFLCVAMNFDTFLWKALGGISGSASPHINVGDIKEFEIITPPIELQQHFSDFVEQINISKIQVQQSLKELETLKKAFMQKYFG